MILKTITNRPADAKSFSVCCLVTRWPEFEGLAESLTANGFDDSICEFLIVDNSKGNQADGFQALRLFSANARGEHLLVVHQDVRFLHSAGELLERIREVSSIDPMWAVLGNAGKSRDNMLAGPIAMEDPTGILRHGPFPQAVESLDENFLIIKRASGVVPSADLTGFHFYGLDACQVARRLGFRSYVIDFMVYHGSAGKIDAGFYEAMRRVEKKYADLREPQTLATTCCVVCWDASFWKRCQAMTQNYLILRDAPHQKEGRALALRMGVRGLPLFPLFLGVSLMKRLLHMRGLRQQSDWWRKNWRTRLPQWTKNRKERR